MELLRPRPIGVTVVALLMILFGSAEVVTAFTHDFFGIKTSAHSVASYLSAFIGVLYAAAGILVLTMRRRAAVVAIVLLAIDIASRAVLVGTGLYPTDSSKNILSVVAGTVIVAVFAVYVALKRRSFRP